MKKILIVSPYFAPENSVASIRFTKIAKYLQQMGYDVTVICTRMNVNVQKDKTLAEDLKVLKNVKQVNYSNLYYKVKRHFGVEKATNSKKNSAVVDLDKKKSRMNIAKEKFVWCYANAFSYILGRRYIRYIKASNVRYDVVISTYSPMSSHILGYYMKKKKMCKVWIADFRDPMTSLRPESAIIAPMVGRYGARLIQKADYITCVSKGCGKGVLEEVKGAGTNLSERMRFITNGFDPEEREALQDINGIGDKLIFTYCGTIYNIGGKLKINIMPLFRALAQLILQGKIDKAKIELRYAGYDSDSFKNLAEKFGISDIAKCYGRVGRDKSLQLQRQSDVILVPVWNNKGEEGIMSGKFFETLLVQRNVLCLVTGNLKGSELATLVRETGCGYAYEEINGDQSGMPQLEEWIARIYNEKMKNGRIPYASDNADQFSHPCLAKQFEGLFEGQS